MAKNKKKTFNPMYGFNEILLSFTKMIFTELCSSHVHAGVQSAGEMIGRGCVSENESKTMIWLRFTSSLGKMCDFN